ncbi:LLM class flavin-dependent oxidoreductase [Pseudonocardia xinjiangensis]|uniref:LLM class flavin-dependent oxidoreductase n=1 Tax=Pseudonocardia xinjiangensis TaxID=75289 RepID=UPI003D94EE75
MISVPLSVLDLTPVQEGHSAQEALNNTVELARRTEKFGYRRFWVTEHHSTHIAASAAPAVLVGQIAATTSAITVGSGGVMLNNHAPLAVAEQFATLDALHPGRIDLGVGGGAGTTDERVTRALRQHPTDGTDPYAHDVHALDGYLAQDDSGDDVFLLPRYETRPALWLLASTTTGARLAAELGLPLAFAHHIRPQNATESLACYREGFRPSRWSDRPYVMLAVQAVCADSDERAQALALPGDLLRVDLLAGRAKSLLSPEAAAARWAKEADPGASAETRTQVRGTPEEVVGHLAGLVDEHGADELMITSSIYDLDDRTRSYELIAAGAAA